jgi:hypothetical protein
MLALETLFGGGGDRGRSSCSPQNPFCSGPLGLADSATGRRELRRGPNSSSASRPCGSAFCWVSARCRLPPKKPPRRHPRSPHLFIFKQGGRPSPFNLKLETSCGLPPTWARPLPPILHPRNLPPRSHTSHQSARPCSALASSSAAHKRRPGGGWVRSLSSPSQSTPEAFKKKNK